MSEIQTQKAQSEEYRIPVLTRRARTGLAVAGLVAAGATIPALQHGASGPDFNGRQEVQITEDTVTGIAHDHVDGSENHINATVNKIVEMNPQVFQDGKAFVESEDVGKTIDVPTSVDE